MDVGAKKLLETVTIETLHANHFSRASSQATCVLTDLLSRYLTLLSTTCAKYAEHAGRLRLNARDAEHALGELGVDVRELSEYCATEGRELSRYAVHTARRVDDLNEFKAALAVGLREDRDDAIPLVYGPVPDEAFLEEEDEELDESQDEVEILGQESHPDALEPFDTPMDVELGPNAEHFVQVLDDKKDERMASPRPLTPALPLSPISNPSTPPRKRPRTSSWKPPPHIPDFLPPFPTHTSRHTPSPPPATLHSVDPLAIPAMASVKIERPQTPPPELGSGAADYRTPLPYNASVLASQPSWHLPTRPASPPLPPPRTNLPITQSALYHAYHHVLTHPPPKDPGPTNPARYKVAVELIEQSEANPRWDPPATLFAASAPNAPRVAPVGPSYPVPLATPDEKVGKDVKDKDKGKEAEVETKLPNKPPRSIIGIERIAPLISQQGSRIPSLALQILPGPVHARATKVSHPGVLTRGAQKLTYGPGVNAQWNSGTGLPVAATPVIPNGTIKAAKEKEKEKETKDQAATKPLPDARMYATWSWDQKSYREPLANTARRTRTGSVQLAGIVGNGRRARSESHHTDR